MKKTFTAALAAMMILSAGTAMAASFPNFDFNGDLKVHYRWNTGAADLEGGKIYFRLNAKSELSKDVDLYARLATERLGGDRIGADFDSASGYYTAYNATAIDRLGFVVKGKDFKYTIGRQDLFLGQGLLYDATGYMGINKGAIDGLTIDGKSGVTNVKFVAGQAWDSNATDTKIYAIDASYSPVKAWTLGATVAKVDAATDTNYWAVNAAYATGKASIFGEYGKSDKSSDNKGYAFGTSYAFDNKNSAYAIYSRTEANTDLIANLTTYDNGGKGMYYGFNHKLSKDYTVSLFYKDMKTVDTGAQYTSLRTTVTYKF